MRLPDFKKIGTWRWQSCQSSAPAPFTPRKYSWYSFLLEAESNPRSYCGQKDYVNKKFQWNHRHRINIHGKGERRIMRVHPQQISVFQIVVAAWTKTATLGLWSGHFSVEICWYSWPCVCLYWSLWRKAEISSGVTKDFKLGTSQCRSGALGIKIKPSTAAVPPETTVLPKTAAIPRTHSPRMSHLIPKWRKLGTEISCTEDTETHEYLIEKEQKLKLEEKWWSQIGVQKRVPEVNKSGAKCRIISKKCFVLFVFCGAAAQRGPWPPHSWCF